MPTIHLSGPPTVFVLPQLPTLVTWLIFAAIAAYGAELIFGRKQTGTLFAAIAASVAGMWLVVNILNLDFPQQPIWNAVPLFTALSGALTGALIWSIATHRRRSRRRYY